MFDQLSQKLTDLFRKLHGEGHLSEFEVEKGLKEIRRILLGADVNYEVVKAFMAAIHDKAVGEEVLHSLTPAQQLIKIVRDEMVTILGEPTELNLKKPPVPIVVAGLQGSGKTTSCAKLAFHLKKRGKRTLLVPADLQRPAAREQLISLAKQNDLNVFEESVPNIHTLCKRTMAAAREMAWDVVIYDTAGRLHVDEGMMKELMEIVRKVEPKEILYVADAMTGQDAIRSARTFHETVSLTGMILTKVDGDSRGGAALSVRHITGIPILFMGVGEKIREWEPFDPDRLTRRILGLGDALSIIEKAEEVVDEKEAEEMARRLKKQQFTLEDLKKQLKMIKKMGSLKDLLGALPMGGQFKQLKDVEVDDKVLVRIEAIINSMTPRERNNPGLLNASRKRRVAAGSGTSVQEINRLLKQFRQMRDMARRFGKGMAF